MTIESREMLRTHFKEAGEDYISTLIADKEQPAVQRNQEIKEVGEWLEQWRARLENERVRQSAE